MLFFAVPPILIPPHKKRQQQNAAAIECCDPIHPCHHLCLLFSLLVMYLGATALFAALPLAECAYIRGNLLADALLQAALFMYWYGGAILFRHTPKAASILQRWAYPAALLPICSGQRRCYYVSPIGALPAAALPQASLSFYVPAERKTALRFLSYACVSASASTGAST